MSKNKELSNWLNVVNNFLDEGDGSAIHIKLLRYMIQETLEALSENGEMSTIKFKARELCDALGQQNWYQGKNTPGKRLNEHFALAQGFLYRKSEDIESTLCSEGINGRFLIDSLQPAPNKQTEYFFRESELEVAVVGDASESNQVVLNPQINLHISVSPDKDDSETREDSVVRYQLVDFFRDIGAQTWIQRILPESIAIGSGRRGILYTIPVLPFLSDILYSIFFTDSIFGAAVSISWLVCWLLVLTPIYLTIESGVHIASIPFWLHFAFTSWNRCQIYGVESDQIDFLGKKVIEVRVGRIIASCNACRQDLPGEIELYFSLFKPWKAVGRCNKAKNDHKYTFVFAEMEGVRI